MSNFDLTLSAVKRQLKAMRVDKFEVGLFHRESNKMLPRTFSKLEVIKSLNWLKSMNFQGNDIFIRPQGSQGLVFFDDFNKGTLEQLSIDGLEPAVVIESSPQNFHGWIRVSETSIEEGLATAICKFIAETYGGDKDSADWRHYGRLAGFTNRKSKYIDQQGKHPFVLLRSGRGQLASSSALLLQTVLNSINDTTTKSDTPKPVLLDVSKPGLKDPNAFFSSELESLMSKYGQQCDLSRADWMIVNKMILRGYSKVDIYNAMFAESIAAHNRNSYCENYINITLSNAYRFYGIEV